MSTIFIAVQCCLCSTMQVKQQKKSGNNKWSCVVCNQKQSVRKVYAQGFMAKDVRKFVQSFNMSRQLADQNPPLEDDRKETLEIKDQFSANSKKKKTDWSEYIDPAEEDDFKSCHGEEFETKPKLKNYSAKLNVAADEGDEFQPKIVTEMPKAVFKKPKLKNYSAIVNTAADQAPVSSRSECIENSGGIRNRFAEAKELQPTYGTSKVPGRNQLPTAKCASKWSCYITEDSDDLLPASGRDSKIQADPFEINELNDQKVEEDIHPDFL